MSLPTLYAGIYRHYKGPLYMVLGYGHDANEDGRTVVVYVGLELTGAKSAERICVRTAEDFFATVDPRTGAAIEFWDGTEPCPVARFEYVGPVAPLLTQPV